MVLMKYLKGEDREEATARRDKGEGSDTWILTGYLTLKTYQHSQERGQEKLSRGGGHNGGEDIGFHNLHRITIVGDE